MDSSKKHLTIKIKEEILAELTIKGVLYSSKNSRTVKMRKGKVIFFGNSKYKKSVPGVLDQLKTQYKGDMIHGPVNLHARVWVRNESWFKAWVKHVQKGLEPYMVKMQEGKLSYSGTDTDNKLTSVFEYLKESHIVHDDCQFIHAHVGKRYGKGIDGDYGAKIYLTRYKHNPDEVY